MFNPLLLKAAMQAWSRRCRETQLLHKRDEGERISRVLVDKVGAHEAEIEAMRRHLQVERQRAEAYVRVHAAEAEQLHILQEQHEKKASATTIELESTNGAKMEELQAIRHTLMDRLLQQQGEIQTHEKEHQNSCASLKRQALEIQELRLELRSATETVRSLRDSSLGSEVAVGMSQPRGHTVAEKVRQQQHQSAITSSNGSLGDGLAQLGAHQWLGATNRQVSPEFVACPSPKTTSPLGSPALSHASSPLSTRQWPAVALHVTTGDEDFRLSSPLSLASPSSPSKLRSPKGTQDGQDSRFREATSIPSSLEVSVPREVEHCSGMYVLVPSRLPNGFPLWKQLHGDHFLFSGTGGRWFIGDDEEENLNFVCNAGIIVSREFHHGEPPNYLDGRGGWQRFDGEKWVNDGDISVAIGAHSSVPSNLRESGGVGAFPTSLSRNSRLPAPSLSMEGFTSYGSDLFMEAASRNNEITNGPHNAKPSSDTSVKKQQQERSSEGGLGSSNECLSDTNASSKELSSYIPSFPTSAVAMLQLCVPQMGMCTGLYCIVRGRTANGFPLWKQQGGEHFLFSGTGGRWFVGDDEEERLHFNCNAGVIVSQSQHKGQMPHKMIAGTWQHFDGDKWINDRSIRVSSSSTEPPREAVASAVPQRRPSVHNDQEISTPRRWRR
jgi:hypothetical protein